MRFIISKRVLLLAIVTTAAVLLLGCGGGGPSGSEDLTAGPEVLPPRSVFADVTATSGLTTDLYGGYGSSWVDFDGDGYVDVWVGNHMYKPTFYRNNGNGTFTEEADRIWTGYAFNDAHGAAWADFDNDGDPDLIELAGVDAGTSSREKPMYVNVNGHLEDRSVALGLNDVYGRGRTPLWLDWNGDGRLDLYRTNFRRPNDELSKTELLIQQADGTFKPLPEMTRQTKSFFASVAWMNGKHYLIPQGGAYPNDMWEVGNASPVQLFPKEVRDFGVTDTVVADFDGDGSEDLFILSIKSGASDATYSDGGKRVDMFLNGDNTTKGMTLTFKGPTQSTIRVYGGTWVKDQILVGSARTAKVVRDTVNGKGTRWIEVTVIGDVAESPDAALGVEGVYISKSGTSWRVQVNGTPEGSEFNASFIGDAAIAGLVVPGTSAEEFSRVPRMLSVVNGVGVDVSAKWGLTYQVACESAVGVDFDNDGDLDVYMSCTTVMGNADNILLENVGGKLVMVKGAGGALAADSKDGGGRVSAADIDNDGFMDLLVTDGRANLGYPFHFGRRYLFRNQGNSNGWIKVKLQGCTSNRDALGSRVVVEAGELKQMKLHAGGVHNGVQDDPRLHFGLGTNTSAVVTVYWPNGAVTVALHPVINRIITIKEPGAVCL